MLTLRDILCGGVLPGFIALTLWLLIAHRDKPWRITLATALAVGLGYASAAITLFGWPTSPWDASKWLLTLVLPASLVPVILDGAAWRRPAAWVLRAIIALGITPLLLQPYFERWTAMQALVWMISLGLAAAVVYLTHAWLDKQRKAPAHSFNACVSFHAFVTGMVLAMSGSLSIGQLGIALACTAIGLTLANLLRPPAPNSPAAPLAQCITPALLALLIIGHFYAELAAWHAVLLALGVLPAALLTELGPVNRWKSAAAREGARLALTLATTLPPLIDAGIKMSRDMQELGY